MNLQTVLVDGVLDGQDNLSNKLPNVLLLDWDLLEKYGGRLERKIIVGDILLMQRWQKASLGSPVWSTCF